MRINVDAVKAQINNLIVANPALADDEILRADMIEGETDVPEFLAMLLEHIGETAMMMKGVESWLNDLRARMARLEHRHDALRDMVKTTLESAHLKSFVLPLATLTLKNGVPKVVITDENALPDDCVVIDRRPNKTAIRGLIENGMEVPGAMLSNAEPYLQIRTK